MRVTVIGRWGGCCRAGEACAGYLVEHDGCRILLDCGSGVAGRVQRVAALEDIDAVVISHWHADHCSDAGVLLHGRVIQTIVGQASSRIAFYAPDQEPDLGRLTWEPYSCSHAIDESSVLRFGEMELTFHRTLHPVFCLATKIRCAGATLVYTADGALDGRLVDFARGCDLLIAECSLYPGADGSGPGHMNADDVAVLARRTNPGRLVLSHLPLYGEVGTLAERVGCGWDGPVDLAGDLSSYEVAGRRGAVGGGADCVACSGMPVHDELNRPCEVC